MSHAYTLFAAIAHGDAEHRRWLKKAIGDHFSGRPVEPPRGANSAEVIREIQQWASGKKEVQDGEDAEAALIKIDGICKSYLDATKP